jgi:hypothetical protein
MNGVDRKTANEDFVQRLCVCIQTSQIWIMLELPTTRESNTHNQRNKTAYTCTYLIISDTAYKTENAVRLQVGAYTSIYNIDTGWWEVKLQGWRTWGWELLNKDLQFPELWIALIAFFILVKPSRSKSNVCK